VDAVCARSRTSSRSWRRWRPKRSTASGRFLNRWRRRGHALAALGESRRLAGPGAPAGRLRAVARRRRRENRSSQRTWITPNSGASQQPPVAVAVRAGVWSAASPCRRPGSDCR
jgi:hypothetical protein